MNRRTFLAGSAAAIVSAPNSGIPGLAHLEGRTVSALPYIAPSPAVVAILTEYAAFRRGWSRAYVAELDLGALTIGYARRTP